MTLYFCMLVHTAAYIQYEFDAHLCTQNITYLVQRYEIWDTPTIFIYMPLQTKASLVPQQCSRMPHMINTKAGDSAAYLSPRQFSQSEVGPAAGVNN